MTARVSLALVGCGAIADWHVQAMRAAEPRLVITAAVDVDPARAEAMAAKTGAPPFTSLAEALAHGRFDAVDLMLPHHLHEEVALQSFSAGKHVILEKPIAPTIDACDRILDAGRRAGTVFMVAENAQYWPEVLTARRLIADGAIGDLVTGRAATFFPPLGEFYVGERAWRLDRRAAGGGIAVDTGSHWLRPLRVCMGEVDETIAVLGYPYPEMEGESLVRALLRFRSGANAVFDAVLSSGAVGPYEFFRFTGTKGEVVIDPSGVVTLYDGSSWKGTQVGDVGGYMKSYEGEFVDFASAVLDGTPLAVPPEYALGELRTALAMYRSAETGRWEKVWADA